jgi:putative FmdB family regulatory protein
MPLFEYSCRHCGHRFEALITRDRAAVCPACQSEEVDKLFSSFGTRSTGGTSAASTPFT